MLLQIYEFISREKRVSTQQLTRAFRLDYSALQPMLEFWVRKGVIQKCHTTKCQSSCFKCPSIPEYYQYNAQSA